jgi:UDP-N-acetylglucosamine 2-epimerase (non-hydrolysing)
MKIMTVLGTRPEIIRLSRVVERLDRLADSHVLVHTGQNYDPGLSELFFQELGVRAPDHYLGVRGDTFGEQIGQIIARSERVITDERPDRLLILGDTNSALSAVVAKRLGIPVYHMEAGNRCYDDRVPEEVNRRIVDHSSDVLLPYTERSRQNLLREGFEGRRVYVTGNPILEVIEHYGEQIRASDIIARLSLEPQKYFLVTMHRAENVDVPARLSAMVEALARVAREYGFPVVCSTHPRTRAVIERFGDEQSAAPDREARAQIQFHQPFGLFDFVALEQNAFCVLSDSGTVQEECCIFGVPNVTLRDVTERPETVECGSNMLGGADVETIVRCVRTVVERQGEWTPPVEYMARNVSETVAKIVLGYRHAH